MKRTLWSGSVFLGMALAACAATNDLTGILQKGLFDEEANHDLPAAMRSYQSVAAQYDKDRKLAATAIYRLGECYLKQGDTNSAEAQFRRVLLEFSDQGALVGLSRQNLERMGVSPAESSGGTPFSKWGETETEQVRRLPRERRIAVVQHFSATPLLNSLLQKLADTEQQLTLTKQEHGPAHPEVTKLVALKETLNRQIDEQVEAILQGIELQEKGDKVSAQAQGSSASGGDGLPVAEADELKLVQRLVQDSPDLINAWNSDGLMPLHEASRKGYLTVVRYLLEHGADPNALEVNHWTALGYAAKRGHRTVAEELLAHHADVSLTNRDGDTALDLAARQKYFGLVELLLKHGAESELRTNARPLLAAIEARSVPMAKLLIERGAQVNPSSAEGDSPLLGAVDKSSVELVRLLLEHGADVNAKGAADRTALVAAIEKTDAQMVTLLLDAKADPNLPVYHGQTHLACVLGRPSDWNPEAPGRKVQILQSLLSRGAQVNQRNGVTGRTPLQTEMIALCENVQHGVWLPNGKEMHVELLRILLDYKANPNTLFNDEHQPASDFSSPSFGSPGLSYRWYTHEKEIAGRAPLHLLAGAAGEWDEQGDRLQYLTNEYRGIAAAELLLKAGAHPNVQDPVGKTPLDYLSSGAPPYTARAKLAALLAQHGGKRDLPDLAVISCRRSGADDVEILRGSNGWNQFTVLELVALQEGVLASSVAAVERPADKRSLPAWEDVVLRSPGADGQSWLEQTVNLNELRESTNGAGDRPMPWGARLEVRIKPYSGSVENLRVWGPILEKCLRRTIELRISGAIRNVLLGPSMDKASNAVPRLQCASFWIRPALINSGCLTTPCDLSRVTVRRRDAASGKTLSWTLDCSSPKSAPAFWLRDGDVVEVPEKAQ